MIRPAAHPPKAWPKDHGSYCPICREFVPAFYLHRCDEPENPVTLTPVEDCHAAGSGSPSPNANPQKPSTTSASFEMETSVSSGSPFSVGALIRLQWFNTGRCCNPRKGGEMSKKVVEVVRREDGLITYTLLCGHPSPVAAGLDADAEKGRKS